MIFIKNYLKISTFLFTLFLFGFLATGTSYANDDLSDFSRLKERKVKVTVKNDKTGETKIFEDSIEQVGPVAKKRGLKINPIQSEESVVTGYEVFVPIESPEAPSGGITIQDTSGSSKTAGGVTARLNVNYDLASGNQIRLNRVYGSWTPSHSMYYIQERKVDAHSGSIWGKNLSKTPSSNSFSYYTGWGYNTYALADGSPRAWSSARVNVSGMESSSYTISLSFIFP